MSILIGCDYPPGYQVIAVWESERQERPWLRVEHSDGQVRAFYASLPPGAGVGMEATGNARWFERLLAELGHELWIVDPGRIRAAMVRKQKTDERDAQHWLELLEQGRFPRLWVPSAEMREARQLLLHRHKLVPMRTRVKNELQPLALNQGLRLRRRWLTASGRQQLEALELGRWAARRRQDLLHLLDELQAHIVELDQAVEAEAQRWPAVGLLRTHPGVGAILGLGFVLTLGPAQRFRSKRRATTTLARARCLRTDVWWD